MVAIHQGHVQSRLSCTPSGGDIAAAGKAAADVRLVWWLDN